MEMSSANLNMSSLSLSLGESVNHKGTYYKTLSTHRPRYLHVNNELIPRYQHLKCPMSNVDTDKKPL